MGGKDEAIPVFGSDVLLPALKAGGLSGTFSLALSFLPCSRAETGSFYTAAYVRDSMIAFF